MSQQITIIVFVDAKRALETNSLTDNIYLVDNLRTDGSEGGGTSNLITAVHGSHWVDNSQCNNVIM